MIHFCSLFLFLIPIISNAQNINFSGEIDQDTNWDYDTVKVDGNVTINKTNSLTISPGTIIEFQGKFGITVLGEFSAVGTRVDSIKFTYYDTTGYHVDRLSIGWNGIYFEIPQDEVEESIFEYCVFEYARKAAFEIGNRDLDISNCTFRHNTNDNGGAMFATEANLTIKNCLFLDNYGYNTAGAIYFQLSNVDVLESMFLMNTSQLGGAVQVNNAFGRIIGCIFSHNSARVGGAIDLRGNNTRVSYDSSTVANCIIVNNRAEEGGGINGVGACPNLVNNTICNNQAEQGAGALFLNTYVLSNNIFWNNSSTTGVEMQLIVSDNAKPFVNNNYIESGDIIDTTLFYIYQNNIYSGAKFKNPSNEFISSKNQIIRNWSLEETSTCINAGSNDALTLLDLSTDITKNERIKSEIVDIGAIEFDNELVLSLTAFGIENRTLVFPNPVKDKLTIQLPDNGRCTRPC